MDTISSKITFLKTYLPELRNQILSRTIHTVEIKNGYFDDIVTDMDLFIQNQLIEQLRNHFPDTRFLAEENHQQDCSDYLWIIDPIDGTKNFFRRHEDYAISIAYYEFGKPLFGMVYDVAKDQLFYGIKDEGAWMNDQVLPALSVKSLNQSVLDMNLKTLYALEKRQANIEGLSKQVFAHRSIGSAAISLCRMALGSHDIYLNSHLKLWDFAAARIILEEVGGVVSFPFDEDPQLDDQSVFLFACTSLIQEDALKKALFE